MSVATVDADGQLSIRMLLMKGYDSDGFVFYTNRNSRKGMALAANPVAALCFHWKSQKRQVRIEGTVAPVSDAESDDYFKTRPVGSRIGAWASQQSQPLDTRATLEAKIADLEKTYAGEDDNIPRPPHWGGYRVTPTSIEFWQEGPFRLHRRVVYKPNGKDGWVKTMLYP